MQQEYKEQRNNLIALLKFKQSFRSMCLKETISVKITGLEPSTLLRRLLVVLQTFKIITKHRKVDPEVPQHLRECLSLYRLIPTSDQAFLMLHRQQKTETFVFELYFEIPLDNVALVSLI